MPEKRIRIFQVLSASANAAISSNQTWLRYLHEPLLDLGCDVHLFPAERGKLALRKQDSRLREQFTEELVDTFIREHKRKSFDLFFSYLMDGMVVTSLLDRIRSTGVPMVNFSCNNAHQFYLVEKLSPYFDLNLHSEKEAAEKFRNIGATPSWWPMASNPTYCHPYPLKRTFDASFAGANYGPRAMLAKHLLDHGIDIHLFGPNWRYAARSPARGILKRFLFTGKYLTSWTQEARARSAGILADHEFRSLMWKQYPENMHGPLSDVDLIKLYSQSAISVGFLDVFDNHDPAKSTLRHLHLREFEAPMSGALYCTGYTEELAEMFEPDKEVIVYRNADELLDKARFYIGNPSAGEKIRESGRARALSDHTYQKRYRDLFRKLGLTK
jgi:spore maturation protein CgeB